jgi:hypothetical protein
MLDNIDEALTSITGKCEVEVVVVRTGPLERYMLQFAEKDEK